MAATQPAKPQASKTGASAQQTAKTPVKQQSPKPKQPKETAPEQKDNTASAQQPAQRPEIIADEASMFQAFILHFVWLVFPLIVIFSPRQKTNLFMRFYAIQAVILIIFTIGISVAVWIFFGILIGIGIAAGAVWLAVLSYVIAGLISGGLCAVYAVFTIIAALKAYNGKIYEISLVGKMAAKRTFKDESQAEEKQKE